MRFAHPEMLWLLFVLLPLGLFLLGRQRAAERKLAQALREGMALRLTAHLSRERHVWRRLLLLLAIGLVVPGLARPQRGMHYTTAVRTGIDLVIALDVSESMLAEDLRPNRLARARHEISALLDRLEGDRVALVAFAGAAFIQCPLTLDYGAARMFLDYMTPELIPEPGTSLAEALRVSRRAFGEDSDGFRAMILISDGEDHEGEIDQAIAGAREAGIRIFTVGVGSETGEPIPLRNAQGEIEGHKRSRDGQVVLTRLDARALEELAVRTGGLFVRAGTVLGLDRVLGEIQQMERRELEAGIRVVYEERYVYFIWLALVCLLIEWYLPLRRGWTRRRPHDIHSGAARIAPFLTGVLLTAGAACGIPVAAAGGGALPQSDPEVWQQEVEENEIYRAEHPQDPRPLYNLGNLYHQKGEFGEAQAFYEAASSSAEQELARRVAYNLGNTLYRAGDPQRAREAFLEALRIDSSDASAKRNLELTQRLLDQLAQMQSPSNGQEQGQEQEQEQERSSDQGSADGRKSPQDQQDDQSEPLPPETESEPEASSEDDPPAEDERSEEKQPDAPASRDSRGAAADSSALSELQLQQILRGLESNERELLKRRFRSRSRNLEVEKDW